MSDLKPFVAKVAAREALNREDARAAFEIIMSGPRRHRRSVAS